MSKAEETALGLLALIGIIVSFIGYLIINYWSVIVLIAVFVFIVDYIKYRKLKVERNRINKAVELIRNNILLDYEKLICNNEIVEMFNNAVIHFPKYLFLDSEYMELFEEYVLKQGEDSFFNQDSALWEFKDKEFISTWIFRITKPDLNPIPDDFIDRVSDTTSETIHLYLISFDPDLIMKDYNMFKSIIKGKFAFSSSSSLNFCTWMLLKESAHFYYSSWWDSNYGQAFESASSSKLSDLVKCYCNILLINHFNDQNITMFALYLMMNNVNPMGQKLLEYTEYLNKLIKSEYDNRKLEWFEKKLNSERALLIEQTKKYLINDTDMMNGIQFENFIAMIFGLLGYKTTLTPASGD